MQSFACLILSLCIVAISDMLGLPFMFAVVLVAIGAIIIAFKDLHLEADGTGEADE